MTEPTDARDRYGADLAQIHAEGFAPGMDGAADWLAGLARSPDGPAFVFDLGCGDGRMLAALAERGVQGAGVDLSAAFVALAQAKGLDVRQGDAATAEIPPATLVIALGEVLCYADRDGRTALEPALRAAHAALAPGGSVVFDVIGPGVSPIAGWREGEGWLIASKTTMGEGQLERRIATFTRNARGDAWRRRDETHRQRILSDAEVLAAAREAGFEARLLDGYGDAALLPGRIAVQGRRTR